MSSYPDKLTMVLVYLPTKLGDFRANVGIHIPAPWFAYGYDVMVPSGIPLIGPGDFYEGPGNPGNLGLEFHG